MGAEDNGGRRRAGADYLQQGPAKRAEEVAIGLLGDASARLRRGPAMERFARFSEITKLDCCRRTPRLVNLHVKST